MVAGHDLGPPGERVRTLEGNVGDRHRELLNQRRVDQVSEIEDTRNAPWFGGVHRGVMVGDVVVDDLGAQSRQLRLHVSLEAIEGPFCVLAPGGIRDVFAEPCQAPGALQVPAQGVVRGAMKEAAQSTVEAGREHAAVAKETGVAGRVV